MPQRHPHPRRVRQRAGQIIVRIVIHQRAGIDPHPPLLLHDHPAEGAHEPRTALLGVIGAHAVLCNLRCLHRAEVRKTHNGDVGRQSRRVDERPEGRIDRRDILVCVASTCDRDMKSRAMQVAQRLECLRKHALPAQRIVLFRGGIVETHPKRQRMRLPTQGDQLIQSIHQRLRAIG